MDKQNLSEYKIAAYIRLSDEDRNKINKGDESESIVSQRAIIKDFVKNSNGKIKREYADDGLTGTNFNRPAFEKMLDDLNNGEIDLIITKDLSRLGRDHIETGYYIEKFFPENRIRYIAITDYYDSSTTSTDMVLFKLTFNDMYSKDISKKILASFEAKKKQGLYLGSSPLYGYIRDPNNRHHLIIDPINSIWVKKIFELSLEGVTPYSISNYLNENNVPSPAVAKKTHLPENLIGNGIWSHSTVKKILQSQMYIGDMVQSVVKKVNYKSKKLIKTDKSDWIIVENTHEPIISRDDFARVQEKMKASAKIKNSGDTSYEKPLLSGLLVCAECGRTISVERKRRSRSLYRRTYCNYYRKYSKQKLCTPHSVRYELLEIAVLNQIERLCKEYLDDIEYNKLINKIKTSTKTKLDEANQKMSCIEKEISKIKNKISRLYDDRLNDLISIEMFKSISENETKQIDTLQNQLLDLQETKNSLIENNGDNLAKNQKLIKDFVKSKYKSKDLLHSIVEKIVISEDKQVDIFFKIKEIKYLYPTEVVGETLYN